LFLCEDNGLAVHTHVKDRQSFDLEKLISAFGIHYTFIKDGYDPTKVMQNSKKVIDFVRTMQSPAFLRIKTARYREHVGPGEDFAAGYRSQVEMDVWKSKDPLLNLSYLDDIKKVITAEIEAAVEFAIKSPLPTRDELLTDVY
jgi:pyruvate dehydrogenase E1 component alpha subunit